MKGVVTMSDSVELSTFPSNRLDGLTLLYLEKQDLSNLSPEEFVDKYYIVRKQIAERIKVNRQ